VIADILSRNDDRKERQMKASLDNIKKKITEVLKQFKTELENKNTRK
jgi:ABC-type Zn uptake system ZnuABC Zn-binding protein ZnuA